MPVETTVLPWRPSADAWLVWLLPLNDVAAPSSSDHAQIRPAASPVKKVLSRPMAAAVMGLAWPRTTRVGLLGSLSSR